MCVFVRVCVFITYARMHVYEMPPCLYFIHYDDDKDDDDDDENNIKKAENNIKEMIKKKYEL